MMSRIFPFPILSAVLFGMWVLLTGFSPGHILLGAAVALLVSRVGLLLSPERARVRFGRAMLKLAGVVIADIVRSNIAVGRIVLFGARERCSAFVELPIDLRSPYALAALAVIITATPGTIWLQHDPRRHSILIHVLDPIDESEWVALIKNRYEKLLMEIFE